VPAQFVVSLPRPFLASYDEMGFAFFVGLGARRKGGRGFGGGNLNLAGGRVSLSRAIRTARLLGGVGARTAAIRAGLFRGLRAITVQAVIR
jgi:hypothetical protein